MFFFFPSIYVICNGLGADMKIAPRGIIRVEILYSSLVELLVMSCNFFILNIKKRKTLVSTAIFYESL